MISGNIYISRWASRLLMILLLSSAALIVRAQNPWPQNPTDEQPGDPGGIGVTSIRQLSFGAFSPGASGGTITISPDGSRSATGTVIPLNVGILHFPAIFEIDAPYGSIISFINGPNTTLTGSNGGTMSLRIGASSKASPFSIIEPQPIKTQVLVGGVLTVGNTAQSPPGSYSGTIYITFNQE